MWFVSSRVALAESCSVLAAFARWFVESWRGIRGVGAELVAPSCDAVLLYEEVCGSLFICCFFTILGLFCVALCIRSLWGGVCAFDLDCSV